MIEIAPGIRIEDRDLHFEFTRAAGPGGQNVNKVASAVQLRFDVRASSLPQAVKSRLVHLAGRRMTREGALIVEARRFRTQAQNKEDALTRLTELVRRAARPPRARRPTKPTKSAKDKRVDEKKRRGEIKRRRQNKAYDM